ncbi:hypothetical protein [Terasakiella pusilla]|uniref:hypothetical protein n=1 Tax=Terasakiella pusilla TaxID=64973 RepID=UPI003AA8F9B7
MASNSLSGFNLPPGSLVPGLCDVQPTESVAIAGVLDIAHDFEVVIFSAEGTLCRNGKTLPAGAVLVPTLRRKERKLAIFTTETDASREELARRVNYLGFSFAPERILLREDFSNLKKKFPLAENQRILLVCSDPLNEIALGHSYGLKTLLITPDGNDLSESLGIGSHYIASSV